MVSFHRPIYFTEIFDVNSVCFKEKECILVIIFLYYVMNTSNKCIIISKEEKECLHEINTRKRSKDTKI